MANGLNQFFVAKVANLVKDMPIPASVLLEELKAQEPLNIPEMSLYELSPQGLDNLIKKVRKTPASGIDNISGIILIDIYETIKPSLLHLINLSMATGIYPSVFKLTKVIPTLKQGKDPAYPSSYRPVSNISVVGKLIERTVMNQVNRHIDLHQLLHKDQHGGRAHHSTSTCLGEIVEDSKSALEGKLKVAIMAVDLTAAYDLCHHGILEQKCRRMNLGSETVLFIRSFLASRSQVTELHGVRSEAKETGDQGVVQGGPSSGNFFNIYINKLPAEVNFGRTATKLVESTHKQYVDDGSTVARGKTLAQLKHNIKDDFVRIQKYLHKHQMVINPSKTQLMQLKPLQEEPLSIQLDGTCINNQDSIKILGLTIGNDLKFDQFVWKDKGSLVRRIQNKTSQIAALRSFLPAKTLHQVGNAIINSTIQYGAAIWGATTEQNVNKVQSAQMRAARIITRKWKKKEDGLHRQEILDSVKWPNVQQLITASTLNLTKQAISGQSSSGMNHLLKVKRPPRGNRNSGLRVDHRGKSDRGETTFSANAVNKFNHLPAPLRAPELSVKTFKNKLKCHIKTHYKLPRH